MAPDLNHLTAMILAGGLSRRMGQDKATIELHGQSLLRRVAERFIPHCADVIVVIRDRVWDDALPVRWVFDAPGRSDVWGAIVTGLEAVTTDWAFVCAVDMPGIHLPMVDYLAQRARGGTADVVAPAGAMGLEPLHAVYHRRCFSTLYNAHLQGHRRLQDLGRFLRLDRVSVESLCESGVWVDWALGNANTPAELTRLVAQLPDEADLEGVANGATT